MSSKSRRKRRIFSQEFERDAVNLVVVKATRSPPRPTWHPMLHFMLTSGPLNPNSLFPRKRFSPGVNPGTGLAVRSQRQPRTLNPCTFRRTPDRSIVVTRSRRQTDRESSILNAYVRVSALQPFRSERPGCYTQGNGTTTMTDFGNLKN